MSDEKITKSDADWQAELTPDQYRVCREQGTEAPFTGAYYAEKAEGTYHCSCCGEPLFDSSSKYDSGTGWPSFYQTLDNDAVASEEDRSHGMVRTEVHCRRCNAHLGHLFPDGPQPTGLRYCINSVSLDLKKNDSDLSSD